mgnify:CR=1 FL=1
MILDLASLRRLAQQATVVIFRDEQGVIQNINPTTVLALLDTIERQREALIRLREELPRLLMPSECGGSLRQCERIIDTALSQGEAG